jgi:hypothetical protein
MYTAKDTEKDKLEVFKRNEKWQDVIKEFLAAWKEFFDIAVMRNEFHKIRAGFSVKDTGTYIQWYHLPDSPHVGPERKLLHLPPSLELFNVTYRRRCLRQRREEISAAYFEGEGLIGKEDWQLMTVNFNHLLDIVGATSLLRERTVDAKCEHAAAAEAAREVHEDRMAIFSDYLDGLAEVL